MARLSDVAEVQQRAAEFKVRSPLRQPPAAEPLLLLVILVAVGLAVLLLVAHAVGWRTDVAVLLVLAGAGIDRFVLGGRR